MIFNQFDEFGNPAWHCNVTGYAIAEVFEALKEPKSTLAGFVSATGAAGTIAAGDYLRTISPPITVVASEALQCPTLLMNGFGGHLPWVHNVRNTDMVTAIDDEDCMRRLKLFKHLNRIIFIFFTLSNALIVAKSKNHFYKIHFV